MTSDGPVGAPLEECPLCGCIGLPERVQPENHDCEYFHDDD